MSISQEEVVSQEAKEIFRQMSKNPVKRKLWEEKYGHLGLPMSVESLEKICPYNCGRLNSEDHHLICPEQRKLREYARNRSARQERGQQTMRKAQSDEESDADSLNESSDESLKGSSLKQNCAARQVGKMPNFSKVNAPAQAPCKNKAHRIVRGQKDSKRKLKAGEISKKARSGTQNNDGAAIVARGKGRPVSNKDPAYSKLRKRITDCWLKDNYSNAQIEADALRICRSSRQTWSKHKRGILKAYSYEKIKKRRSQSADTKQQRLQAQSLDYPGISLNDHEMLQLNRADSSSDYCAPHSCGPVDVKDSIFSVTQTMPKPFSQPISGRFQSSLQAVEDDKIDEPLAGSALERFCDQHSPALMQPEHQQKISNSLKLDQATRVDLRTGVVVSPTDESSALKQIDMQALLPHMLVIGTTTKQILEMLQTLHIKFTTFGYDLADKVEAVDGAIRSIHCLLGQLNSEESQIRLSSYAQLNTLNHD